MNREEIENILKNQGFVAVKKTNYFGDVMQYTIADANNSYTVCVNEFELYLTVAPVIDIDEDCVSVRIYSDGADGLYLGGMSFVFDEIEYFEIE